MSGDLLFERRGALAVATLNRPKALNALTLDMCLVLNRQLRDWAGDPAVQAVLVRGAGDRAFCAGGDIRAIYDAGMGNRAAIAAPFFQAEYRLDRRVHRFPKPYVALLDGITMGGGVGISVLGAYRVASERFLFAMPETGIGLFPDIGATWFLNRCPGQIGRYLGLTGARIGAADALYCGLVTHHVPSARHAALIDALAASFRATASRGGDAAVAPCLAAFATSAGEPPLAALREGIDRCFAFDTVEEIVAALEREAQPWAKEALERIAKCSPSSLKVTLRQLRQGASDVEASLRLEYRIGQHVMDRPDFFEGVRALIVDKDQTPRWQPPRLQAVGEATVALYFEPLGTGELGFDEN
jgi:enoyl-CoA hydratase